MQVTNVPIVTNFTCSVKTFSLCSDKF